MAISLRLGKSVAYFVFALLLGVATQAFASYSLTFRGLTRVVDTGGVSLFSPTAAVVDANGNLYIADTGIIVKVNSLGVASTLTITGLTPALSSPAALALDASNNLYVVDVMNNYVAKITPSGAASVLDLGGLTLTTPNGVAVDPSGNIFIADTGANRIVKVTSGGVASVMSITIAPALSSPRGLYVSPAGVLYIADTSNNRIVSLDSGSTTGAVVTILGGASFSVPVAVTGDFAGNLFIADSGNNRIVERAVTGYTSTLGTGSQTLADPIGVAVDVFGQAYICDSFHRRVLQVDASTNANVISGDNIYSLNRTAVGFGHVTLGSTTPVTLTLPFTIGSTALGSVKVFTSGTEGLDFTSTADTTCSASSGTNTTCDVSVQFLPTAPGLRRGAVVFYDASQNVLLTTPIFGFADAPIAALSANVASVVSTGSAATLNPYQVALDGAKNLYVGAYSSSKVFKVPVGGGSATAVTLPSITNQNITGVAIDGAGNLFIADHQNARIVVLTPGGVASVLSITGLNPLLGFPTALALDAADNLYIGDFTTGRVVRVSSINVSGATSTGYGTVIATGVYSFYASTLTGIAVAPNGNVYVAARTQNTSHVVQVTPSGVASLVSPTGYTTSNPQGVTVDGMGNLYIVDTGNSRILRVTASGVASALTLTGLTPPATTLGPTMFGVTVDEVGNLYISDWTNNRIVYVNVTGSAKSFASTKQGMTSTDSPWTGTVTNLGDQPLIFATDPSFTADFSAYGSDANPCASTTTLAAGALCDVAVQFTPQSVGSLSAAITVTNNHLNVANSTQSIAVSGVSTNPGDVTATAVTVTPSTLVRGQAATITATVTDTPHSSTTPTGSVTFTDTVGSTSTTLNGGSAVALVSGVATLNNVVLSGVGSHTITASYGGVTGSFIASSNTASATVDKASAALTADVSSLSVVYRQGGSATLTLTPAYATIAMPSGSLSYTVLDSSSAVEYTGSATLTAGAATSTAVINTPYWLTPGAHTLSVTYGGDDNYLASSTPTTIAVQVGKITPTISWSPSTSAITYGATLSGILDAVAQGRILDAVRVASAAPQTPTQSPLPGAYAYTATPANGSAASVTSDSVLGAGSYTLDVQFTPTDTTYYNSASASMTLTVAKASTSVALVASATSSLPTTPVTFTATVTGATSGGVSFYDGSTLLGSAVIANGQAAYTASSFAVGTHAITAVYAGDANYESSASAAVTLTVAKAPTSVALVSSSNPSLVTSAVTFTATVSGAVSGGVSFYDGSTLLGAVAVANGGAAYTTSSLAVGAHAITAVYAGDVNNSPSTSSAIAQVVQDFSLSGTTGTGGAGGGTGSGGSSAPPSQTVLPGGTASYSLALLPSTGASTFPVPVTLSVSGLPPGATATVSPSFIPANTVIPNVTLSVQLPSSTASARPNLRRGLATPFAVTILLLPFAAFSRRARRRMMLLMLALIVCLTAGLSGCGNNNGFFASPQKTYTVTVTATAGSLSHAYDFTLVVK